MRRGCISLGEVKCDECHRIIPYPERYLAIDEKDGTEDDEGETSRYCIQCSLKKGYARYKTEKGERVLTFFPE
jgi:ribosomal protein S26